MKLLVIVLIVALVIVSLIAAVAVWAAMYLGKAIAGMWDRR
jgi:hypothetical protein